MTNRDAQELLANPDLFQCPRCRSAFLLAEPERVVCSENHAFPVEDGLPILFSSHDEYGGEGDVTDEMQAFYMDNPFPDYEDTDSVASLVDRARQSVFAKSLDEAIPFGARVLEVGCGTGQLSLFLSVAQRHVVGVDLCPNSLKLAIEFRNKHRLDRAFFYQMNLFKPIFKPDTFDVVYCSGVLHHTGFPRKGFEAISRLVRPGGHIVIGLYNKYMRIPTHIRRSLSRVVDIRRIDPVVRRFSTPKKKQTWFMDQYRNPHETDHSITEVMSWLKANQFEFLSSIPAARIGQTSHAVHNPFELQEQGSVLEIVLSQIFAIPMFQREGGLFLVTGRRIAGRDSA